MCNHENVMWGKCQMCQIEVNVTPYDEPNPPQSENAKLRELLDKADDAIKAQAAVSELFLDSTGEIINEIKAALSEKK